MSTYQHFTFSIKNKVASVSFNRPEKANSLNKQTWAEMKAIFEEIDETPSARVAVLSGEGKHFCAGIDLQMLMDFQRFQHESCEGRKRELLRKDLFHLQDCITAIEKCRKPVIAAIHKACIGGAVDIVTACDMRYSTEDAYFSIKEIDMGLVADIGTLQRLPKIIQPGIMAEMAYTGRKVFGPEAAQIGLVNRTYSDKDALHAGVKEIAEAIATKSPLVVRGTKEILKYTRDHSVSESLNYVVAWNASMLMSNDLMEAMQAQMQKREPTFED